MRTKILVTAIVLMTVVFQANAQRRSMKETKVVLVVSEKSKETSHIELLDKLGNFDEKEIHKKYPNHKFYLGMLTGGYEVSKKGILPVINSNFVIYKNRELFLGDNFIPGDQFFPGDQFNLGSTTAEVLSNKKDELVLSVKR